MHAGLTLLIRPRGGGSVMGSRSIKVVLATVGVLTLASVGQAVPAGAALTPVLYGFGSNQAGELGNGTTTASLSPTPVTGLPGTVRQLATGLQSAAAEARHQLPDGAGQPGDGRRRQ